jgi:hypothetical protein
MTERSDRITARDPAAGGRAGQETFSRPRHDPTPGDPQRFARALHQGTGRPDPQSSPPSPGPEVAQPTHSTPTGPFALLGRRPESASAAVTDHQPKSLQQLQGMVKSLAVGRDGSGGNRRSVRLGLDEESWPGVEMWVFEDAGAWVAQFRCRDESSFLRLAAPAREMAAELARELQHDAVWCVVAEQLPHAGSWQVWINHEQDGHPAVYACSSAR